LKSSTKRKTLTGTVVSDKMDKTVVVRVERRLSHSKFKKVVKTSNKYKVHDENNECRPGDYITICETRPLSKFKRWRLLEILKRAESVDKEKSE